MLPLTGLRVNHLLPFSPPYESCNRRSWFVLASRPPQTLQGQKQLAASLQAIPKQLFCLPIVTKEHELDLRLFSLLGRHPQSYSARSRLSIVLSLGAQRVSGRHREEKKKKKKKKKPRGRSMSLATTNYLARIADTKVPHTPLRKPAARASKTIRLAAFSCRVLNKGVEKYCAVSSSGQNMGGFGQVLIQLSSCSNLEMQPTIITSSCMKPAMHH
ncbi:hypothetical protein LY78DRAFT_233869 [Colletotrichum sublineola]|nr:hypothetical protein LY78DRAFT_233869 [Colletotrichum sublineola]